MVKEKYSYILQIIKIRAYRLKTVGSYYVLYINLCLIHIKYTQIRKKIQEEFLEPLVWLKTITALQGSHGHFLQL